MNGTCCYCYLSTVNWLFTVLCHAELVVKIVVSILLMVNLTLADN